MPSSPTKPLAYHLFCWASFLIPVLSLAVAAEAQYPGRVQDDKNKKAPSPRAISVLEWVEEAGKPKASRIVPVSVFDNGDYQDGGLYLAKPQPLALESGTEYVLLQAGVSQGLFDISEGESIQGAWFGYGVWKPLDAPPAPPKLQPSKIPPKIVTDADPDRPHFKDNGDAAGKPGSSAKQQSTSSDSTGKAPPPVDDPDKPTLHRRPDSNAGDSSGGGSSQPPPDDPDRPHLKKRTDDSQPQPKDSGAPATAASQPDPDRPRLTHGKPAQTEQELDATRLTYTPPDLKQMVAVSDADSHEPHPFAYQWANPRDADKAKSVLETIARSALAGSGITPAGPAAPTPSKTPAKAGATAVVHQKVKDATAAPAVTLSDEHFEAYELSYSGGATLVFSAKSGEGDGEKYITIIAQPDFYGVPQVRLQSVTDAKHLDITPRMRLVDAVDTDGDNRAELVFEMRGKTDRQFAIYRVMGSRAKQIFATSPLPYEIAAHVEKKPN